MQSEQQIRERLRELAYLLKTTSSAQTYKRRMLVKEYGVLYDILFNVGYGN